MVRHLISKIKNIFSKEETKSPELEKQKIKDQLLKKLNKLSKKDSIEPQVINPLIRNFFRQYYGWDYEFSYLELIDEIQQLKIKHKTKKQLIFNLKLILKKSYSVESENIDKQIIINLYNAIVTI